MTEAFPYHVLLYLQVLVDKVRPVCAVCHDTSHVGGGKDYIFRSFLVKEVLYGNSVQQVQFLVASAGQVGVALFFQVTPNSGAHESVVPWYINFG